MSNITRSEAMIFALAVREAVEAVNPVMPNLTIMWTAMLVDFKADDIPAQVIRIVNELTSVA